MNTAPATTNQLACLPIFSGIGNDELRQLADIAKFDSYDPGVKLIHQGESGQNLWVILEGKCKVIKMTSTAPPYPIDLAELGPNDHFGEMSFFHAAPHSATVQATEPVKTMRINRKDYDQLLDTGCTAAYLLALNSVDELADRLRRMDDWVTELVCNMEDNHQAEHEWTSFREKLFSQFSE